MAAIMNNLLPLVGLTKGRCSICIGGKVSGMRQCVKGIQAYNEIAVLAD